MSTLVVVLLVAAGSFALRYVPLSVGERLAGSERAQRLAGHGAAAALAALVAGAVAHQPDGATHSGPLAVTAALAAGALAVRRGWALHLVVLAGVAAHWVGAGLTVALIGHP